LIGSRNRRLKISVKRRINFGVGGEQYNLVACLGEVALHQLAAMLTVEATKLLG